MGSESAVPVTIPDTMTGVFKEEGSMPEDDDDTCLEKRVYYKVISGAQNVPKHDSQTPIRNRFACVDIDTHLSRLP
jgi:hypothetical protein